MVEEDSGEGDDTPLQSVVAGGVTFLTLAVAFGLMALGAPYFWVAFPVGFGGALPLAVGLVRWYESRDPDRHSTGDSETDAALADLRERYARGELSDEEFERRVERLLETESVGDAREFAEREGHPAGSESRERERA